MLFLAYLIHIVICFFLILVVLLQQGKGADLSVFGGGGTMTAFGARGAATLLHKMTVFGFVGFIVTTLSIGILQGRQSASSVMSGADAGVTATVDGEEAADGESTGTEPGDETPAPAAGALLEDDAEAEALPEDDEAIATPDPVTDESSNDGEGGS